MSKELISNQLITSIRDKDREKQAIAILISPACFSELANEKDIGDRLKLHDHKYHTFIDIPILINGDIEGWEIIVDVEEAKQKIRNLFLEKD